MGFLNRRWLGTVFVTFSLAACDRRLPDDPEVFRMPLGGEPPTIDPQLADTGTSVFLLDQILSTLLRYDAERRLVPYDAESYEWRPGGLELAVKLRSDLKWSDGEPVRACQYRDGIRRALDPKTPSLLAEILFEIEGARERKAGRLAESKVGVKCDDKKGELSFLVVRPYTAKLLHALAFVVSAPIRREAVAARGSEWLLPTATAPGLATGAFRIKEWNRTRRLVFEARGAGETSLPLDRQAGVKRVDFPFVPEPATALAMYERGELDVIEEIPTALLPKLRARPDHVVSPYFTTYMVGFSMTGQRALRDPLVRRALAFTAHQDEVPKILGGGEEEAKGWVPPLLLRELVRPKVSLYRPDEARVLFQRAGYGPSGKKFPQLTLLYNAGERHRLLVERLANNWKRELGIDVLLEPMDWKVFVARLRVNPGDMYRYAWAAVYPDPAFFLELFTSTSANNFGKWSNADFDRIVSKLASTPLEKRDDLFWKDVERAQRILVEEDPALVPLYHYVKNALVRPNVKGLEFNWRGTGYLRSVRKQIER